MQECPITPTARALVATAMMRSGLGNRLSFILSSQAIADAEHREFFYHWPVGEAKGKSFGAHFHELWNYEGGAAMDTPGPEPMLEFSQHGTPSLTSVREAPVISLTGNMTVKGYGGERPWGDLLAELTPTEEVLDLADSSIERMDGPYVGVQVRAHPTLPHKKTLQESPVSWFIDRMRQMREDNPSVRFFLSCD